jgi:hypothetical protein
MVDCYHYDGKTLMGKRYLVDFGDRGLLFEWLKELGLKEDNEEKCGIRLDNRLVINVIKRQAELEEVIFGKNMIHSEQSNF